jgi:hypothetical protein
MGNSIGYFALQQKLAWNNTRACPDAILRRAGYSGKFFSAWVADQAWITRCSTRTLVTVEVRSKIGKG